MLSLLQLNKNITERLGIILLTLLVTGQLSKVPLSFFDEKPVESIVQALYFFGYVTIIGGGLLFLPLAALLVIQQIRIQHSKGSKRFLLLTGNNEKIIELLEKVSFIVATVLAISGFGTSAMKGWGTLGLAGILLSEIIDFGQFHKPEFLKITITTHNQLKAQILTSSEEQFQIDDTDLYTLLSRLEKYGWEQVHLEKDESERNIILRKK